MLPAPPVADEAPARGSAQIIGIEPVAPGDMLRFRIWPETQVA